MASKQIKKFKVPVAVHEKEGPSVPEFRISAAQGTEAVSHQERDLVRAWCCDFLGMGAGWLGCLGVGIDSGFWGGARCWEVGSVVARAA